MGVAANSGCGYCMMYRLVKDCSKTSGLQAQAMDSLQEKLKTLQSSIDQEKTAFVQAKVLSIYKLTQSLKWLLTLTSHCYFVEGYVLTVTTKGRYSSPKR